MPKVKILFGVQVGVCDTPQFFEEVKEFDIPQEVLDLGEEDVKEYLVDDWSNWVDYHTSSIIELVEE